MSAFSASSHVYRELSTDGFPRYLVLILLDGADLFDVLIVAKGAKDWNGRLKGFVELIGSRAVSMKTVIVSGFSSGFHGFGLGRSFGERRGLPLSAAAQVVGEGFEATETRFKALYMPLHCIEERLASFAGFFGHLPIHTIDIGIFQHIMQKISRVGGKQLQFGFIRVQPNGASQFSFGDLVGFT